jgi:hypothetical protein
VKAEFDVTLTKFIFFEEEEKNAAQKMGTKWRGTVDVWRFYYIRKIFFQWAIIIIFTLFPCFEKREPLNFVIFSAKKKK